MSILSGVENAIKEQLVFINQGKKVIEEQGKLIRSQQNMIEDKDAEIKTLRDELGEYKEREST